MNTKFPNLFSAGLASLTMVTIAFAANLNLPNRITPAPQTTNGVPHVQIDVMPIEAYSESIQQAADRLPFVELGATRVSLPGAIGFHLDNDLELAHPEVIVGGREFAHIHPDGSLHASLDPEIAQQAIEAGWAVSHPWADMRDGWEGFVLLYTPQNETELAVVQDLVQSSYEFVTGQIIEEN